MVEGMPDAQAPPPPPHPHHQHTHSPHLLHEARPDAIGVLLKASIAQAQPATSRRLLRALLLLLAAVRGASAGAPVHAAPREHRACTPTPMRVQLMAARCNKGTAKQIP